MDSSLQSSLQRLGDLELAVLVSLIAEQHCMVSCAPSIAQDFARELEIVCRDTFGLQTSVVQCTHETTVDKLSEAVLVEVSDDFEDAQETRPGLREPNLAVDFTSMRGLSQQRFGSMNNNLDDRRIADIVIINHLDLADSNVQNQTLELLRTKRIFTRTSMHTAPKTFLCIATLSGSGARLRHHLNDMFAISHYHAEEDGLPHVDGEVESGTSPVLSRDDISGLQSLVHDVTLTAEVSAYLHNIVILMRNSRYVKGGVTAAATRNLHSISKALAPLHGLDFVPPSLVALAVRKIYPHRLVLATVENERSLQWGSDPEAVRQLLEGVTIEDVIEDVLGTVGPPM